MMNEIIINKIKADVEYDELMKRFMENLTFEQFMGIVSNRMWYKNKVKEAMEIYYKQLENPDILKMYQNMQNESCMQNYRFKFRHLLQLCNCLKGQQELTEYELMQLLEKCFKKGTKND